MKPSGMRSVRCPSIQSECSRSSREGQTASLHRQRKVPRPLPGTSTSARNEFKIYTTDWTPICTAQTGVWTRKPNQLLCVGRASGPEQRHTEPDPIPRSHAQRARTGPGRQQPPRQRSLQMGSRSRRLRAPSCHRTNRNRSPLWISTESRPSPSCPPTMRVLDSPPRRPWPVKPRWWLAERVRFLKSWNSARAVSWWTGTPPKPSLRAYAT